MKFGALVVATALFVTVKAYIPSLTHIARILAYSDWNADYHRFWMELQGDALTAAAVSSRDSDQMQAALLLAGTVISKGVELPVGTNGLAALCEVILSPDVRDEFLCEDVFQEKRKTLLQKKTSSTFRSNVRHEVEELFPLANMHYVCGNDLPLQTKVIVFKQRVLASIVDGKNTLGKYKAIVPPPTSPQYMNSLDLMFKQLQVVYARRGPGRAELALLFDVVYSSGDESEDSSTRISEWLNRVFEKLFNSQYFTVNKYGEYQLISGIDVSSSNSYMRIGELFGLAIMNNVSVRWPLDNKLLQGLSSNGNFGVSSPQSIDVQTLRLGFYEVTSMNAVWGCNSNPKMFFTGEELGDVLRGNF